MNLSDHTPSLLEAYNGNFIGLIRSEEQAKVVVIAVPWDVSLSSTSETAACSELVLEHVTRISNTQYAQQEGNHKGLYLRPASEDWIPLNVLYGVKAKNYLELYRSGEKLAEVTGYVLEEINNVCGELNDYVYRESAKLIKKGQMPAVLGGDNNCSLGLLKAIKEHYAAFGVLQIDAHMNLKKSFEGFTYSHASVYYNALDKGYVEKLVQVGIRDFSDEEEEYAKKQGVVSFGNNTVALDGEKGKSWHDQCDAILSTLPQTVFVSLDVDGLNPTCCPNTALPVNGGLEIKHVTYLLEQLAKSGKQIIGFDVCQVAGRADADAKVAAELLLVLANGAAYSNGWI